MGRLVGDDEEGLLEGVQLVDERLEPRDQVEVRLAVRVARRELINPAEEE